MPFSTGMHNEESIYEEICSEIKSLLDGFRGTGLDELNDCRLMNRYDRKFSFRSDLIPVILTNMDPGYSVLEVEGRRLMNYESCYFDTPEKSMYLAHHNGKASRYKIRLRKYTDTGIEFLEIKHKNNRGEVCKYRTPVKCGDTWGPGMAKFVSRHTPFHINELESSLISIFRRFTLVNFDLSERITIDSRIRFRKGTEITGLPALAVAEIKSGEKNQKSPFFTCLRDLRIKEGSFSKYCTGMVLLNPGLRKNIFKEQIYKLKQQQDEFTESYYGGVFPGYTVHQG